MTSKRTPTIGPNHFPNWRRVVTGKDNPYGEPPPKVAPDEWLPGHKTVKKADRRKGPKPIKIKDMHTMQLVNAIKWCIKSADATLRRSPWSHFGTSRARLLAPITQWQALLAEAKERKLKIVYMGEQYGAPEEAQWFQDAMEAIVWYKLSGGKRV